MTRLQIRDLIRKKLGETTAAFWTDTELNTWINDAGHDIAFKTKCQRTNGTFTTVEGTAEYTATSQFSTLISIFEVYYYQDGSSWEKLTPTTRTELDHLHPGWLSAANGTPYQYYFDREEDVIRLYVPPDSTNAGTDYCKVFYAYDYVDVTGDSTESPLPARLHDAQVDYVTALGFEQRGHGDKANDAWQKYYTKLKIYMGERSREKEDEEIVSKNYRNI